MAKSLIDKTFDVYMQMRLGGKEAKATLEALRFRIQIMPNADQAELVRRVKAWEGKHRGAAPASAPARPKPVQPVPPRRDPPSFSAKPPSSNSPAKGGVSSVPPSSRELEDPTPASTPAA